MTNPTPFPDIPVVGPWGDFGGIIGDYDGQLTGCNSDKAGVRVIIDDYLNKLNLLFTKEN